MLADVVELGTVGDLCAVCVGEKEEQIGYDTSSWTVFFFIFSFVATDS